MDEDRRSRSRRAVHDPLLSLINIDSRIITSVHIAKVLDYFGTSPKLTQSRTDCM
jgi:hypothetical protein